MAGESHPSFISVCVRVSDRARLFETFKAIRWAENEGGAFLSCGCTALYFFKTRRWKCKGCNAEFSVTSGTIFASRKLKLRDILAAIAIFTNDAKGHSALQLSRDLDVQYKTAFVLSHKIREAMASNLSDKNLEVDGGYFGGYVKPANRLEKRRDLRLVARTGYNLRYRWRNCAVIWRFSGFPVS